MIQLNKHYYDVVAIFVEGKIGTLEDEVEKKIQKNASLISNSHIFYSE
jgi:hypothetical protein